MNQTLKANKLIEKLREYISNLKKKVNYEQGERERVFRSELKFFYKGSHNDDIWADFRVSDPLRAFTF